MYSLEVKKMLKLISKEDAVTNASQTKYCIEDGFSTIEMYLSVDKVSFRVYGSAYILAMTKWLQIQLKNNCDMSQISLECLVEKFDVSADKTRDAVQILELIEQINEE